MKRLWLEWPGHSIRVSDIVHIEWPEKQESTKEREYIIIHIRGVEPIVTWNEMVMHYCAVMIKETE